MNIVPVRYTEQAYKDYAALFAQCFPHTTKYCREYLNWLYLENPDGEAVGFDARDGDKLVAHYACIPVKAHVAGTKVKALLSLNTATHPDYQGRGLFTQLAERTYDTGSEMGFDFVFGIANSNSTPGFLRKLDFQLISSLQAKIGLGTVGIDFEAMENIQFRRFWSPDTLAWRLACPINPVRFHTQANRTVYSANALLGRTCMVMAELQEAPPVTRTASVDNWGSPLKLFIGLVPPQAARGLALFTNIPQVFRPSPLNLIYRSLSDRVEKIDRDSIFLTFLDFDAY